MGDVERPSTLRRGAMKHDLARLHRRRVRWRHVVLRWKRTAIAVLVFGAGFGYPEAAVVTYLRQLHEPARHRLHPGRPPSDLFPLMTFDQLRQAGAEQERTRATEIGREATITMLAAVALAVAHNAGQWAAAFVIAFGT